MFVEIVMLFGVETDRRSRLFQWSLVYSTTSVILCPSQITGKHFLIRAKDQDVFSCFIWPSSCPPCFPTYAIHTGFFGTFEIVPFFFTSFASRLFPWMELFSFIISFHNLIFFLFISPL